jgi:hypothetical protein
MPESTWTRILVAWDNRDGGLHKTAHAASRAGRVFPVATRDSIWGESEQMHLSYGNSAMADSSAIP